jgi:protein tyrosine phosphatase
VLPELAHAGPMSAYINANRIAGASGQPNQFIAAMGPKEETIGEWWRMIWQEKVQAIVMLTNVVERGKRKCEDYVPHDVGHVSDCAPAMRETHGRPRTSLTLTVFHSLTQSSGHPSRPHSVTHTRTPPPPHHHHRHRAHTHTHTHTHTHRSSSSSDLVLTL